MRGSLTASLFFWGVLAVYCDVATSSIIYHTDDAIITQDRPFEDKNGAQYEKNANNFRRPSFSLLLYLLRKRLHYQSFGVPASTLLLTDEVKCRTSDGKFGTCSAARSCHPSNKLETFASDQKLSGSSSLDTCRYVNFYGKEVSGVCCPRQSPLALAPGFMPNWQMPMPVFPWPFYPSVSPVSMPNILTHPTGTWPWWVPQAIPTASTTTESPSTTSPWWVPEVTSTTPSPDSQPTTSPWWVPETTPSTSSAGNKPTTSPWWVPETTSTRPPVGTTSSWWSPSSSTVESITTQNPQTGPIDKCGAGPYKAIHLDDQKRIVGGMTATRNAWPFAVSLVIKGRHFCGGSILDSLHILTAAHCIAALKSEDLPEMEIILGMHSLQPMDPQAVKRKLRRVVRHKDYQAANFHNDIAILTMDSPVQFNQTISPVCLPSASDRDLFVGREAVVVGWGALQEDGKQLPTELQQVTVQVQRNDECKKSYDTEAPGGITDKMLCAAYPNKDSCMGDSGGPLVMQLAPGASWVQIGIVSWGIGCGRQAFPGVYVRVTSFTDWINKNL